MKHGIGFVLAGLLGAGALVPAATTTKDSLQGARQPWQVGTCYRAYLDDEKPPHLVKVTDAADAPWIRIEPQPSGPRIPGARERDPMWINTAELFAAQEAPCPSGVGR